MEKPPYGFTWVASCSLIRNHLLGSTCHSGIPHGPSENQMFSLSQVSRCGQKHLHILGHVVSPTWPTNREYTSTAQYYIAQYYLEVQDVDAYRISFLETARVEQMMSLPAITGHETLLAKDGMPFGITFVQH